MIKGDGLSASICPFSHKQAIPQSARARFFIDKAASSETPSFVSSAAPEPDFLTSCCNARRSNADRQRGNLFESPCSKAFCTLSMGENGAKKSAAAQASLATAMSNAVWPSATALALAAVSVASVIQLGVSPGRQSGP